MQKEKKLMRTVIWFLLAGLILPCLGCAGNSALNGKWLGSVTENGKSTKVALDLQTKGDAVAGTFTIFGDTADTAGKSYVMVNPLFSDKTLQFSIFISGQLDPDAVFFELLLVKGRLEGFGRKYRQGSQNLPAIFTKQKK
jgi:hypothetical protein